MNWIQMIKELLGTKGTDKTIEDYYGKEINELNAQNVLEEIPEVTEESEERSEEEND